MKFIGYHSRHAQTNGLALTNDRTNHDRTERGGEKGEREGKGYGVA